MMVDAVFDSEADVRLTSYAPDDVEFSLIADPQFTAVDTEPDDDVIIEDRVMHSESGSVDQGAVVGVTGLLDDELPTFSSTNTNIATVTPTTGVVERVADGTVGIVVKGKRGLKRVDVTVSRTTDTVLTFDHYSAGSLARYLSDDIDGRLVGKTGADKPMYTTLQHGQVLYPETATYIRNPNCWAAGVDLTPIPPYMYNTTRLGGIAVGRRTIMSTNHNSPGGATTIRFCTADNQVVQRLITAWDRIPLFGTTTDPEISTNDIRIGILDEDLPETIAHASVFPADILDYLPSLRTDLDASGYVVPLLARDQQNRALVTEWNYAYAAPKQVWFADNDELNFPFYPMAINRQPFFELPVPGDSSSPICAVVNDSLVVVGVFSTSMAACFISARLADINSTMDGLGCEETLTEVDLSAFTNFS